MLRLTRDFFQDPKTFAYADFWAMVPKWALSTLLALSLAILVKKIDVFFAFLLIFYPFVALIVDVFLYAFRHRLWKPLANDVIIPAEWNISASELEQYAKILPKARLMRVLSSVALMVLFIQKWDLLMAIVGFVVFFLISVLFDSSWLAFFKVTEPKLFKTRPRATDPDWEDFRHRFDAIDPSILGSSAWIREQMNPTIPGTSAWIAKENIDSL